MGIVYAASFRRMFKKLDRKLQEDAVIAEDIFRIDFFDPRIETHKLHGRLKGLWAFSVNYRYRIVFEIAEKDKYNFLYIGDHSVYE